jgi:hypothetical protein
MNLVRRSCLWLATAAVCAAGTASAADPKPTPAATVEEEFLEFLGTFDAEDDGMDEYFASEVVTKTPRKDTPPAPATGTREGAK